MFITWWTLRNPFFLPKNITFCPWVSFILVDKIHKSSSFVGDFSPFFHPPTQPPFLPFLPSPRGHGLQVGPGDHQQRRRGRAELSLRPGAAECHDHHRAVRGRVDGWIDGWWEDGWWIDRWWIDRWMDGGCFFLGGSLFGLVSGFIKRGFAGYFFTWTPPCMDPSLYSRYFLVKEPVPEVLELLGAARARSRGLWWR